MIFRYLLTDGSIFEHVNYVNDHIEGELLTRRTPEMITQQIDYYQKNGEGIAVYKILGYYPNKIINLYL